MSIGAIGAAAYANQVLAYEQFKTTEEPSADKGREKEVSTENDSVSISDEARAAAENETVLKAVSERAYAQLKIRKLSDEDIEQFTAIVKGAGSEDDAKAFLKSLSADERDLVKRANSYGYELNDAHIDMMTEEGARNMLVEPDPRAFVDFNNDGIVDRGIGKTFVFPPPNAPDAIKDAWDKTTQGMTPEEKLMATSAFLVQQLMANIKHDAQGKVTGFYSPGDDGYANIFPTDTEGWQQLLDKVDAYLNWAKKVTADPAQQSRYDDDLALMASFRKNLETSGQ